MGKKNAACLFGEKSETVTRLASGSQTRLHSLLREHCKSPALGSHFLSAAVKHRDPFHNAPL